VSLRPTPRHLTSCSVANSLAAAFSSVLGRNSRCSTDSSDDNRSEGLIVRLKRPPAQQTSSSPLLYPGLFDILILSDSMRQYMRSMASRGRVSPAFPFPPCRTLQLRCRCDDSEVPASDGRDNRHVSNKALATLIDVRCHAAS
jgi:hypothetical protein